MPIVIRELVIRARLEENRSSSLSNDTPNSVRQATLGESEMEHIVALCIEKVMETLERKKER